MIVAAWVMMLVSIGVSGLVLGLWLDERGRRQAAERYLATGYPTGAPRAVVTEGAPEAEDRLLAAAKEATRQTIKRGYDQAVAELRAKGQDFDPKQLKRDIAMMVSGFDVEAPE
jgi:hypothetical protein